MVVKEEEERWHAQTDVTVSMCVCHMIACIEQRQQERLEHMKKVEATMIALRQQHQTMIEQQFERQRRDYLREQHQLQTSRRPAQAPANSTALLAPQQRPQTGGVEVFFCLCLCPCWWWLCILIWP